MRQPKKDVKMQIRLTAEEREIIKKHFADKDISISEYIRKHLYLSNNNRLIPIEHKTLIECLFI